MSRNLAAQFIGNRCTVCQVDCAEETRQDTFCDWDVVDGLTADEFEREHVKGSGESNTECGGFLELDSLSARMHARVGVHRTVREGKQSKRNRIARRSLVAEWLPCNGPCSNWQVREPAAARADQKHDERGPHAWVPRRVDQGQLES